MLGKLMKYEFRDTAKLMLTTYAGLAFATILGSIALHKIDFNYSQASIAGWVVLLAVYIFAIIGIYVGDFIYLCGRYYKTMYSSQGYLTHTLPVNPMHIFSAKLLTAFIWMLISTIVSVLSAFILTYVGTGANLLKNVFDWTEISYSIRETTEMSPAFFFTVMGFSLLLSLLYYILFVYACMAIGQLFNRRRTGFSILAGFGIYLIQELTDAAIVSFAGFRSNFVAFTFMSSPRVVNIPTVIRTAILLGVLSMLMYAVLLYLLCNYINKKRLNLE